MTTWVMTISKHLMLKTNSFCFCITAMACYFKTSYVKNKLVTGSVDVLYTYISKHLMLKTNYTPWHTKCLQIFISKHLMLKTNGAIIEIKLHFILISKHLMLKTNTRF